VPQRVFGIKALQVKREWGANPLRRTVGVCIERFCCRGRKPVIGKLRRQAVRMRTSVYTVRVTRPAPAFFRLRKNVSASLKGAEGFSFTEKHRAVAKFAAVFFYERRRK